MKAISILFALFPFVPVVLGGNNVRYDSDGLGPEKEQLFDLDENKIIGGQLAADTGKKWPWFVHTGQCGGSLVAPDVVLRWVNESLESFLLWLTLRQVSLALLLVSRSNYFPVEQFSFLDKSTNRQ